MREIKLTQGKIILIDDDDFEWVSSWKWQYRRRYASRIVYLKRVKGKNKNTTLTLHREILKRHGYKLENMEVDHINGNTLDNRKLNLRVVNHLLNSFNQGTAKNNTSGRKGVSWYKRYNKWTASIRFNGKLLFLGNYEDFGSACKARLKAERTYFGDYMRKEVNHE